MLLTWPLSSGPFRGPLIFFPSVRIYIYIYIYISLSLRRLRSSVEGVCTKERIRRQQVTAGLLYRAGAQNTPQQAPNPPEFAQPGLSRSNGSHRSHPQREATDVPIWLVLPRRWAPNLGVFVPIWLALPWREATSLGVFDICHFDLLKRGYANSGEFGAR